MKRNINVGSCWGTKFDLIIPCLIIITHSSFAVYKYITSDIQFCRRPRGSNSDISSGCLYDISRDSSCCIGPCTSITRYSSTSCQLDTIEKRDVAGAYFWSVPLKGYIICTSPTTSSNSTPFSTKKTSCVTRCTLPDSYRSVSVASVYWSE